MPGVTRERVQEFLKTLYPEGREKRESGSLLRQYEPRPWLKLNRRAWCAYRPDRFPAQSVEAAQKQSAKAREAYGLFMYGGKQ